MLHRSKCRRSAAIITTLVLVGFSASACGTTKPSAVPPTTAASLASPAQQAATLKAKNDYRRLVIHAAEGFAEATAALQTALNRHDHAQAVHAWEKAQGSFDALRPALLGGPAASASYDGLVADFGQREQPVGLHQVERGLFTGRDDLALAAAPALTQAGPAVVIGLYRTIVQPSGVATKQVEQLGFLVDHVIAHHQEAFSHLDIIDLRAIVQSVRDGYSALAPLGTLVDPQQTNDTLSALGALERLVATIAPETHNEQISPQRWRALSEAAVRLQAAFGQLGGELSGFTSGRSYA